MTLAPGARVGSYEILALLGAGGMGEVYRARDAKLNRDVALKVLPELFTADADRLARFRREAQVLGSLNHPNIGHIYGFDDSGDTHALVLELVEGPTLAERIEQGPLALDETLPIARQIADALECAHEQGIVHRDLKPANIKVRADGTVKVLDFGLAKAFEGPAEADPYRDSVRNSPTLTARGTQLGMIIGTAAYMAPEQARGRAADRRADIWAFGVVLFEMLTGKRTFDGDDISTTLASVLKDDVRWSELPPDTPPSVRRLLRRCLEKDPKRRLSAIGDARLELEDTTETAGTEQPGPLPRTRTWARALPWTAAAIGTVAALTMVALWRPWSPPAERPVVRVSAEIGAEGALSVHIGPAAVISPDGKVLVFVVSTSGRNMLHVRRMHDLRAVPLQGTEDAFAPFFSPDSQWIAFFTPGKLKKVAVTGGAVVPVCEAVAGRGGWWGENDNIVFQPTAGPDAVLHRVSATGGTSSPVGKLAAGESTQRWPQILPGGKAVLYTTNGGNLPTWDGANLVVQPLTGGEPKVILSGGYHGRYVDSGHILYIHESTLFSVPFDMQRLEIRGNAVPVIDGILAVGNTGGAQFSIARSGTLVYVPGKSTGWQGPVSWMDRNGKTTDLRTEPADWSHPHFSPDGRKLAMTIGLGAASDVWVYEWPRDTLTKLTFGSGIDHAPVWSPDGSRIVYSSSSDEKSGVHNLFWKPADGTGEARRLTNSPNPQVPFSFDPGGKYLAYTERRAGTGTDLMILPLETDEKGGWKAGTPVAFLETTSTENAPMFSPDGRWIAYILIDNAKPDIYVRPFPGGEGKWKISDDAGGMFPIWSRAGRELLYLQPGPQAIVMAAEYEVEGVSFRARKPRQWSSAPALPIRNSQPYDLHPDGKRIAMLKPSVNVQQQTKPVLVLNFTEELRRLTPGR